MSIKHSYDDVIRYFYNILIIKNMYNTGQSYNNRALKIKNYLSTDSELR